MSKFIDSGLRASSIHLPVGKVLAGVGAALLLAGPSAAFAQSRECPVQFSVSNATDLGALQFNVDYAAAAAKGDFSTDGCTFVPSGLTDANVNVAANTVGLGFANTTAFSGPGLFVTCTFVMPTTNAGDPVAGNFVVSGIAGSTADVPPVDASPAPTIAVAIGTCANVESTCQNGVLESGESCDDGNAVAGDGCDAACGTSGCPSTPSASCRVATVSGKSKLSFKNSTDDAKDQGQYQWKNGAATLVDDWKTPTTAAVDKSYSLCVYDNGALVKGASASGGAGWTASGSTGFQFKGDAQGMSQIKLKGGDDGKASVAVKASGKTGHFRAPGLPLTGPTVSQFLVDDGVTSLCFQMTAGTPSKNDAASYSAVGAP